jgi:DNA modification methylase
MQAINKIIQGDCITGLKTLPDKSVNCCVTSPPYYGLRDYGTAEWEGGDVECDHRYRDSERDKTSTLCGTSNKEGYALNYYKDTCPKCNAIRKDNQIGLEETPEQYVEKLVEVFREVKRVLRDDGTVWLNLGDSYTGNASTGGAGLNTYQKEAGATKKLPTKNTPGLKPKDLIGRGIIMMRRRLRKLP